MAIVREDVVKLLFDVDDKGLQDAEDALDALLKDTKKLGGSEGTGKAEDGFDDAAKAAKKFGNTDLGKLNDGLDKTLKTVGSLALKLGTTAVKGIATFAAAGTAGVVALGTQAVQAYAEYEQLIGGVETLFGNGGQSVEEYTASIGKSTAEIKAFQKANGLAVDGIVGPKTTAAIQKQYEAMADVPKKVLANANDAYKTAGMSANDYMNTVTSFSASMIASLGGDTAKAAELSDQAIRDMSDNANKMGSDVESIVQTYQSLARGNYAMLDNLKLGYGGTKAEMERLLKDAEKLTGQKFDISNFADITQAIHAIQTEMGITGTTAKEASETIQGSALAMKAAWTNFIGGMANEDADFDQLFDNLMDSVLTFTNNIVPVIKKMLPRLIRGLTEIGKSIGKELPGIMQDLVPELAKGVRDLLGSLWDVAKECAPMMKKMGLDLVKYLYEGFTGKKMSGEMFATLEEKVDQAFDAIKDITVGVADFARQLTEVLGPALAWLGDVLLDAFSWIGDNIDWLLPVLSSLLGGLLAFRAVGKVAPIISSVMGLFGKGGGAGGGGGFFGSLASLKPATILKGMANLSIILIGLGALAAVFAWAAPHIAELSDWQSMVEVMTVMAALGLLGTAMSKLAGSVGNIPVATVAKGLANMAIVLAGLGALTAVFVWLAPYINKLGNMEDTKQLLIMIGVVGLVGSALAGLAGLVGAIPIAAVLTGLGNIALALGGFTAIVAAYGALAMIPGFDDFMTSGGDTLANICRILGEVVGSIIGGIGEGITNSLPAIGENLSAFATSIQPMFETFSGVDTEGLKSFSIALAALIGVLAGEKLVSVITGGINYAELGTNLTTMASNMSGFFSTIMTFPDGGFEKATALFNCLAGISSLPKDGGVVGWFQGEVNFANMATGLNQLAGTVGFFAAIQAIPEEAFAKATQLFNCLAGVSALPKDGGIAQWFTGTINYESLASGLQTLSSESMIGALTRIASIPPEAYISLNAMFSALAGITELPSEGGIFQWFTGDKTSGLTSVAAELPGVATNVADFFTNIGGRTDFSPISNLFNTLSNINLDTDVADKGFWSGVSQLGSMGTELSTFATNASSFFTMINGLSLEKLTGFFDSLGGASELPSKLEGLDGTIGTTLSNMQSTIETGMEDMKTKVTDGMNAIVDAVEAVDLYDSGADMMNGLNRGILSKKSAVLSTARSIANSIRSTINKALDINSPSRVTFDSGVNTGEGIDLGMQSKIPDIKSTANDMGKAAIPYSSGYTPENSGSVYNSGGNNEQTTIAPVFNLTISGSSDDRSLARRVKRWVHEAMDESFQSIDDAATVVVREG